MKDNEKKVTKDEEVKEEVQTEKKGAPLTDEELSQVTGGKEQATDPTQIDSDFVGQLVMSADCK